jgi:hypothetical protein
VCATSSLVKFNVPDVLPLQLEPSIFKSSTAVVQPLGRPLSFKYCKKLAEE